MPSSPCTTALDEPQRDSLHFHIGEAEFSVGDFELYYRMHQRAGRAIKAVLEGAVDEAVRNEAAYRLARIHFQKDQAADALVALDRISGKVPVAIRDDVEFLRANVYMALGRPADAAGVLKRLQGAQSLTGFAAYNLGIALLQEGREPDAITQLDRAGQLSVSRRRSARDPRQVEHAARQADAGVHRLRARAAVLRSRAPRRAVLEPGAAERRLGGRLGAELRTRSRAVEHSRQARSSRTAPCRKRCWRCRMRTAS